MEFSHSISVAKIEARGATAVSEYYIFIIEKKKKKQINKSEKYYDKPKTRMTFSKKFGSNTKLSQAIVCRHHKYTKRCYNFLKK